MYGHHYGYAPAQFAGSPYPVQYGYDPGLMLGAAPPPPAAMVPHPGAHPMAHHPHHGHPGFHPAHPHQRAPIHHASPLAAMAQFSLAKHQPTEQRQVLPINSNGTIAAATAGTAQANPQRTFQCERFVIGSTSSGFFTLQNILFGVDSMFAAPGTVDAEIFSQTGQDMSLYGYIAVQGVQVTVQCTNTSGAARAATFQIVGGTIV